MKTEVTRTHELSVCYLLEYRTDSRARWRRFLGFAKARQARKELRGFAAGSKARFRIVKETIIWDSKRTLEEIP